MKKYNTLLYHIAALFTIIVWGTTLVSSKILINEGLSPAEIMIIRFIMAYVFLWILYPHVHKIYSWKDEVVFLGMGITSGSLYFFFENTALVYTSATNVSLICALIPIFTATFSYIKFRNQRLKKSFWAGSVLALAGTVFVVLNGSFSLSLNPFGDFLAFMSIVCWAIYGVLVKCLKFDYKSLYVTRKIFFYGIITMIPYFVFNPFDVPIETLTKTIVIGNLCFLGFVASSLCYFLWTMSMRNLGVVKTNNYVYFSPLITIVTAHYVLSEKITIYVICGTMLILCGLWIATGNWHKRQKLV